MVPFGLTSPDAFEPVGTRRSPMASVRYFQVGARPSVRRASEVL